MLKMGGKLQKNQPSRIYQHFVLVEEESQPAARKVMSLSLLQIFGNPNKMLDWRTNLILLTNI